MFCVIFVVNISTNEAEQQFCPNHVCRMKPVSITDSGLNAQSEFSPLIQLRVMLLMIQCVLTTQTQYSSAPVFIPIPSDVIGEVWTLGRSARLGSGLCLYCTPADVAVRSQLRKSSRPVLPSCRPPVLPSSRPQCAHPAASGLLCG